MGSPNGIGLKIIIIIAIITVNSLGVLYLARESILLPPWLHSLFSYFENETQRVLAPETLFIAQPEPMVEPVAAQKFDLHTSNTIEPRTTKKPTFSHVERPVMRCLDKKKPPKTKALYTWVDGRGVKTISDKPRVLDEGTSVMVAHNIEPEAISINYLTQNLTNDVKIQFREKVKTAMDIFAGVTPKEAIVPVEANLRSFSDEESYHEYRKRFGTLLPLNVGFYSANKNESVILIREAEETVRTVVHEVMHTINRHWYGQMVQWLDEGMADYSEAPNNLRKSDWSNYFHKNKPIPLLTLFEGSREKWKADSQRYYATSWALVAFLMEQDKSLMSRLLLKESENGCAEITAKDIKTLSGQDTFMLEQSFHAWLDRKRLVL